MSGITNGLVAALLAKFAAALSVSTFPAGRTAVLHRTRVLDADVIPASGNNGTIVAADVEQMTFTAADDIRYLRVSIIQAPYLTAKPLATDNVFGVSFTLNPGDTTIAAQRLAIKETDNDERSFRLGIGQSIEIESKDAITNLSFVSLVSGGTTYAGHILQVEAL